MWWECAMIDKQKRARLGLSLRNYIATLSSKAGRGLHRTSLGPKPGPAQPGFSGRAGLRFGQVGPGRSF